MFMSDYQRTTTRADSITSSQPKCQASPIFSSRSPPASSTDSRRDVSLGAKRGDPIRTAVRQPTSFPVVPTAAATSYCSTWLR